MRVFAKGLALLLNLTSLSLTGMSLIIYHRRQQEETLTKLSQFCLTERLLGITQQFWI